MGAAVFMLAIGVLTCLTIDAAAAVWRMDFLSKLTVAAAAAVLLWRAVNDE